MTLRILIVDDEPLARRGLRLRLGAYPDVEIVGECAHGQEVLDILPTLHCDLMLLDVQMPGMDGFETLAAIPAPRRPLVVFVTAFQQHAIRAFEAAAIDYLLKPVEQSRLATALERARQTLALHQADVHQQKLLALLREVSSRPELDMDDALASSAANLAPDTYLAVRDGPQTVRVAIDSIRWIEAAGDYMCIYTDDGNHILRTTLNELESKLDPRRFTRVHRSRIVNLTRVRALRPHMNGEYFLDLDCGHEIKLSRSYRDRLELLR